MKKYILDMKVTENCHLHKNYCLLKLTSDGNLPEMLPGQFVEVHVENSPLIITSSHLYNYPAPSLSKQKQGSDNC